MKNRTISLTLTVLLLASLFASCGEDSTSIDTIAPGSELADTTEMTEGVVDRNSVDDELGSYNFEGYEFRIATCNNQTQYYYMEESTGDVVNDAIYDRNRVVEERFNCKITVINDSGHRETGIFTNSIAANEDAIDLVCWQTLVFGGFVTSGYFMNWYDISKINFNMPWWSDSNIDHLTYDGFCPVAIGDFVLSALSNTYCIFYNKTMGLNYDIPDVYETVYNGEWTIDYLVSITKDIYQDLNANNTIDEEDFIGYVSDTQSNVCTYMWAFDNPIYRQNNSGELEFSLNLEKSANITEKLFNIFSSNDGIYLGKAGAFNYGGDVFSKGLALFANGQIGEALSKLRDLEDDYAILPFPKWDENQGDYYTIVDGSHQIMAVPVTVSDTEKVGVIIEALCAESYKNVVPAYYDVALKLKGTRDNESIEMLDRIVNSRVFDFGFVYDNWLGAGFIMQDLFVNKNSNFASYWASKESAIMAHYEEVIEYFESQAE